MGISFDNNMTNSAAAASIGADGATGSNAVGSGEMAQKVGTTEQTSTAQRATAPSSAAANLDAVNTRDIQEAVTKGPDTPSLVKGFVPSLGAAVGASLVQFGAEMREQAQSRANVEFQSIISTIQEQADKMMQQMKVGLGMSITGGILQGATGVGMAAGGVKDLASKTGSYNMGMAAEAVQPTKLHLGKEIVDGLNSAMTGSKDAAMTGMSAEIKELQAIEQQHQSSVDSGQRFADSLKQMAEQALSIAKEMVASSNQSMQKILA